MHTGWGTYTGAVFYAQKNRAQGFFFSLGDGTQQWSITFGENVSATRWRHFVIVYNKGVNICAYIDGQLVKCGGTSTAKSLIHANFCFRLGYYLSTGHTSEVYLDDFAVWKSSLNAQAVREIYDLSKV